jgi:hypothetical protein
MSNAPCLGWPTLLNLVDVVIPTPPRLLSLMGTSLFGSRALRWGRDAKHAVDRLGRQPFHGSD